MPRTYIRKLGSRRYRDYSESTLSKAVAEIKRGKSAYSVSKQFKIPYSTIYNKLKGRHSKPIGGQQRLSVECEKCLAAMLETLADWLVPITYEEIKFLVKNYLDQRQLRDIVFKNNIPGKDWLTSFMIRNNLTKRVADNIRRCRVTSMKPGKVNSYFDYLERELLGLPPANIFNYDETNLTDDPGSKTVIVSRGRRRVQTIMEHSKQSTSVMFSGNAAGDYLPPMVVYKTTSCATYEGWCQDGPTDAVYDSTESGWFDSKTFCRWFFEIFLPHACQLDGPVAVIGDNLPSHFTLSVITATLEHKIRFITLIPSSTHICQPLDVAVFRSLKRNWRKILVDWRRESKSKGSIPKTLFPRLLKRLVETSLIPDHMVSGFRKTGIYPANRNEILQQLPGQQKDPGGTPTVAHMNNSVMSMLKDQFSEKQSTAPKRRGKKILHGKRITPQDLLNNAESTSDACKDCMQAWDSNGDDRWIQCDRCDLWYHLQCSGVDYNMADYDDFDITSVQFQCDNCGSLKG